MGFFIVQMAFQSPSQHCQDAEGVNIFELRHDMLNNIDVVI